jgi:hypothetical protein
MIGRRGVGLVTRHILPDDSPGPVIPRRVRRVSATMAGMAGGRNRFMRNALKYGVKYGPLAYEAFKHGKEPAQQAVQQAMARRSARKTAIEHADTLRNGTVLKVMHEGRPIWFVFSDDEIIATYPQVPMAQYGDLLRHTDLANRVKPQDMRPPAKPNPASLIRRRR